MSRTPDPTAKIALLRAAEEVFAEKGLARALVEEITKRAGTSKGAFYLHFESKEEAFEQVVESFLARLGAMLAKLPSAEEPERSPVESLAMWRQADADTYEFLWQNRAIVSIVQGCQGDHVYLLDAFRREIHARTAAWIAYWKRTSFYRPDLDADLAATLVIGGHNEMANKMLSSPTKPPIDDWVRKAQAIFVRAFGTKTLLRVLDEEESEDNPKLHRGIQRTRLRAATARARAKVNG